MDIQQACFSYTWIDGVTYSESTNTPSITLTNQYGCDSIVQLNLTIDTVNTSIEVNALEIQSLASNATYQWLDCDNDYSEIQDENVHYTKLPQMEAMPLSLLKVFVQTPRIVFPFKQLVF